MKAAKVTKIPVMHIEPNPHNPRRLFDEKPMKILRDSIDKLGVLVPITVYPKDKDKYSPKEDHFILLDGERRWRCVKSLNRDTIPAIIVEHPSESDNILRMFHIHNLREGWQLMPTALKLEVLMKKLKERNDRKLYILTRLTTTQIKRCKILLSYPKKYQNMMLAPPSKRLKTDFFIELYRIRGPALRKKASLWIKKGDSKCINIMLDKYFRGTISAVTEFRDLAEVYRGSVNLGKSREFDKILDEFLSNKDMKIEAVVVAGASFEKETRGANKSVEALIGQLNELELEALASNEQLIVSLKKLHKLIQNKLEKALVMGRDHESSR
ncbi:MAG: ParB N-terminal domain-containing protein [Methanophagales archaeon]|nr:ParB N-terminal domain-containing protein [Methanophagales archaeon]